jgi:hypothetical protein
MFSGHGGQHGNSGSAKNNITVFNFAGGRNRHHFPSAICRQFVLSCLHGLFLWIEAIYIYCHKYVPFDFWLALRGMAANSRSPV